MEEKSTMVATIKRLQDKIDDLRTGFSSERIKNMSGTISNLEIQIKSLSDRHNKDVEEIEQLKSPWVSDGSLPGYGEPVLVIANGVVQNIIYCLDASDDEETGWYEPYHFGMDEDKELVIPVAKVTGWQYIPPTGEQG